MTANIARLQWPGVHDIISNQLNKIHIKLTHYKKVVMISLLKSTISSYTLYIL